MNKSISDLMILAGTGANIVMDAKSKSTSEILVIVGIIGRKNSHLTLINASYKPTSELLAICRIYPNNITLDFTNSL